jgi:hypothetical protein
MAKYVNRKVIPSFLGMLLLAGGVGAGVLLVLQPQLLGQKAATTTYTCTGGCQSGYQCNPGTGRCEKYPSGVGNCANNNGNCYVTSGIGLVENSNGTYGAVCDTAGHWTTCAQGYVCSNNDCVPSSGGSSTTPKPTTTPKPSLTPKPTATPTPPVVSSSCTNWVIDEHSGTGSNLANINSSLTSASNIVKFYDCFPTSSGVCDFENIDSHPTTGVLYSMPNRQPSSGPHYLYTINTKANDGINDGTLTKIVALDNRDLYITSLSFRRSDMTLWAWGRGEGLYKIDYGTGKTTKVMGSALTNVEGIAWDNGSRYLYLSRTPQSTTPKYASFELHRYDANTNAMAYFAPLPGFTDDLDFAPTSYLNGYLVGMYRTGSDPNTIIAYTYNVATKSVVKKYNIPSSLSNNDAFAVCIPN